MVIHKVEVTRRIKEKRERTRKATALHEGRAEKAWKDKQKVLPKPVVKFNNNVHNDTLSRGKYFEPVNVQNSRHAVVPSGGGG